MNVGHFPPPKRRGLLIHGGLVLLLAACSAGGFIFLSSVEVGLTFLLALLAALLAFAPIPFLIYRWYSLWRADYYIDRDSLALNWGLRMEDIPLTNIEWIRPASDLTTPLALPSLSIPGAILGTRRHSDLGAVEFLAADAHKILLVATAKRVFAISPADPSALAQTFARATEMGSLSPTEAVSVYPSFVVSQAWESALARYFWLSGAFMNLGLFVWTSLLIPATPRVALGSQFGALETVPSTQLILLPTASLALFMVSWLAGLYFYRSEKERVLAFIVWFSGAFASLLFLAAIMFVVTTPV